ncbi:ParB N-terminal domain-containing protein [Streptomyces sp. AC495_CC817]|uniref:ParB N-terminal domain-containing protein n=1 Tax=Streptomyces sp. AC495_CC817 TaxID=2823900 RepID=UPI001C256F46|nr:ParB N-terminal domain-containing protein [Streptomyces sp. AC495_CC817]
MSVKRSVRFDHLIGVYAVGSGDWSWAEEYDSLIREPETQALLASIRTEGIREPVLLGNDGRVWDGHHRIVAAMHLELDTIPVEFSGHAEVRAGVVAEEPEWKREEKYQRGVGPVERKVTSWVPVEQEGEHRG